METSSTFFGKKLPVGPFRQFRPFTVRELSGEVLGYCAYRLRALGCYKETFCHASFILTA
jgi:hypothetical protein